MRLIVFRVVTVAAGLIYGYATTLLPVPWTAIPVDRAGYAPADIRWELALMGASTGVVLAGLLLASAWRPVELPLLPQVVAAGIVLDVCLEVPVRGPAYLALALPAVVAVLAYPRPRSLLEIRPGRRPRPWFVLFGLVTGGLLLARVVVMARRPDEWVDDAAHTVLIAAAVLLTLTGRPGWRIVAALVGAALLYLGVVAVVLPSSVAWGPVWGPPACVAGLAYGLAAVRPATVTTGRGLLTAARTT
ncbi:hypothetical protein [Actinoplanes sp. URMC 104]|uniref:hypothetical protein n=1 Tax=Actinoplanes sp. URMC 104 TaxID=3423409 RepID=UPI003F1C61A1